MTRFEELLMKYASANRKASARFYSADCEAECESIKQQLIDFANDVKTYAEYQGTMLTSTEEMHYRQALKTIDEMTKEVE